MAKDNFFDDLKYFSIRIPTRIEFGWEVSKQTGKLLPHVGENCLVITEDYLLSLPFTKEIIQSIETAGGTVQLYTDFEPEPDITSVDKAGAVFNQESTDVIVAVGGGSTIDFAKSISLSISEHKPIWDYVHFATKEARPITTRLIPVVAVPTTSGTGSEVTQYAVLSNRKMGCKAAIISPHIAPATAIVDPALTLTLPPELTASTGADALAHAIESFLNLPNQTPFSAMVSLEAIRTASSSLVNAVADGNDRRARQEMSWASLLGGLSISMAGTGLGHAMAEMLGGRTHISHGKTVAVLLPAVLKLLEVDYRLALSSLREALGKSSLPAHEQIRAIWRKVNLPLTMADLEIGDTHRQTIRQDTLTNAGWAMNANPIRLDTKDVDKILAYLWPE